MAILALTRFFFFLLGHLFNKRSWRCSLWNAGRGVWMPAEFLALLFSYIYQNISFWNKLNRANKTKKAPTTQAQKWLLWEGAEQNLMSDLPCNMETFIYELFTNLTWHLWIFVGFLIVRILHVAFLSWWVTHYSFLLIATRASKQQSSVSIPGSDHWAFCEQRTTASNINSKYHIGFYSIFSSR